MDGAQFIRRNQYCSTSKFPLQLSQRKSFAKWSLPSAGSLDQQALASLPDPVNMRHHLFKEESAAFMARRNQWRDRSAEVEGVHFINSKLSVLRLGENLCVPAVSRADRLHGKRMNTALPQLKHRERSDNRLPDACPCSGDYNGLQLFGHFVGASERRLKAQSSFLTPGAC